MNQIRSNLIEGKGIGRQAILALLHDIPDINEKIVRQQIENLKASADYARIIKKVR